jgi:hypothetical protein
MITPNAAITPDKMITPEMITPGEITPAEHPANHEVLSVLDCIVIVFSSQVGLKNMVLCESWYPGRARISGNTTDGCVCAQQMVCLCRTLLSALIAGTVLELGVVAITLAQLCERPGQRGQQGEYPQQGCHHSGIVCLHADNVGS